MAILFAIAPAGTRAVAQDHRGQPAGKVWSLPISHAEKDLAQASAKDSKLKQIGKLTREEEQRFRLAYQRLKELASADQPPTPERLIEIKGPLDEMLGALERMGKQEAEVMKLYDELLGLLKGARRKLVASYRGESDGHSAPSVEGIEQRLDFLALLIEHPGTSEREKDTYRAIYGGLSGLLKGIGDGQNLGSLRGKIWGNWIKQLDQAEKNVHGEKIQRQVWFIQNRDGLRTLQDYRSILNTAERWVDARGVIAQILENSSAIWPTGLGSESNPLAPLLWNVPGMIAFEEGESPDAIQRPQFTPEMERDLKGRARRTRERLLGQRGAGR